MHISIILFFGNLFSSDMIIIVFVALLLFGGEKLPEIARGLGKGIRDFKDASEGVKREINNQINSFEEKRQEEKLEEEATVRRNAQNQLTPGNENSTTGYTPVENTIAVNENHIPANENVVPGDQAEVHNELVTENHVAGAHTDTGATNSEPIKN